MSTYLKVYKGTGLNTTKVPIVDGQLLFETDTKKIWLDVGTQRLQVGGQDTIAWGNITGKPSYYDAKAIKSISRSGTTFTYTCLDGSTGTFTQQDNNTTYSAGTGLSLSGTTFSLNVSGAKTALGLGSNAYTSTAYLPLTGGNITGILRVYNTQDNGFFLHRHNGSEAVKHYLNDTQYILEYTNDERENSIVFKFINTDTEGNAGANPSSAQITFACSTTSRTTITANNFAGNASTASKLGTSTVGGSTGPIYLSSGTAIACSGRTVPGIKGTTAVGNLGWGTNNNYVPDISLLAHWNGAYSGTSSNLAYCSKGAFGTIVTKNTSDYLATSGGTMTGQIKKAAVSTSWINGRDNAALRVNTYNNYSAGLSMKTTNGSWEIGVYTSDNLWFSYASDANYSAGTNTVAQFRASSAGVIYGAAWNDYAEYRQTVPRAKPGQIVTENGDGTQRVTTERLQRGCNVVSDTFGFAIGETDECKTPIACAGRALVYTYENRYDFQPGEAVCSGPNGTVSRMTREEMINNPDCIVGFVSEIPEYEVWGTGNVEVDGRIWIKVK